MSNERPDLPVHVACIMDGNGRWAGRRGLARTEGHTEGEENLARLVRIAVRRNIGWLTVFGFSTENWIRPAPRCATSSASTPSSSAGSRSSTS